MFGFHISPPGRTNYNASNHELADGLHDSFREIENLLSLHGELAVLEAKQLTHKTGIGCIWVYAAALCVSAGLLTIFIALGFLLYETFPTLALYQVLLIMGIFTAGGGALLFWSFASWVRSKFSPFEKTRAAFKEGMKCLNQISIH